jgi:hypothetical protein
MPVHLSELPRGKGGSLGCRQERKEAELRGWERIDLLMTSKQEKEKFQADLEAEVGTKGMRK